LTWEVFLKLISYESGSLLPLTSGASALVLLEWLDAQEARELLNSIERPSFTERTLTSVDDLMDRLNQIRLDGHSISHGEVDPDVLGMVCPLFGQHGEVVAGLSIIGLGSRIDEDKRGEMLAALKKTAREISDILALSAG
jgi:DNA-binding IclR family transcriptional regulator